MCTHNLTWMWSTTFSTGYCKLITASSHHSQSLCRNLTFSSSSYQTCPKFKGDWKPPLFISCQSLWRSAALSKPCPSRSCSASGFNGCLIQVISVRTIEELAAFMITNMQTQSTYLSGLWFCFIVISQSLSCRSLWNWTTVKTDPLCASQVCIGPSKCASIQAVTRQLYQKFLSWHSWSRSSCTVDWSFWHLLPSRTKSSRSWLWTASP